jgi:2-phosphoglycerate kinase
MHRTDCERTLERVSTQYTEKTLSSERQLMEKLAEEAFTVDAQTIDSLNTLFRYENLRREGKAPSLTIMIEGASATGKSMIAIDAIELLAVTRIISTDTIRQLIRAASEESMHPELFTHTYQAHKFRQNGAPNLSAVVRGYLAQCSLMREQISRTVDRIIAEGVHSIIEGVHIEPGQYSRLSEGVLEILIDPPEEIHRSMFLTKLSATGLRTVDDTSQRRLQEYRATREIQDYLKTQAVSQNTRVLTLTDYASASAELAETLMKKIKDLLQTAENK